MVLTLLVIAWQSIATEKAAAATQASADLMKRQSDTMEKQAAVIDQQLAEMRTGSEIAKVNAEAAKDSARAALDQAKFTRDLERARLAIRFLDRPELSGPEAILGGDCPLRVCAFVENLGRSRAFNVRASGILHIFSNPTDGSHDEGFLQSFLSIIDEGPKTYPLKLGGFGREFEELASVADFLAIPEATAQEISEGRLFIQASGLLTYEDIFGDNHRTPFRFVWKSVGNDDGGRWRDRSFWLNLSEPST